MKTKIYAILAILIIAPLLLWGYHSQKDDADTPSPDNKNVAQERLDLHFGHQGVEDFRTHQSGMDMHPVGMGFMDLRWSPPNLGKVRVVTDYTDLEIDHIFKVTGIAFNRPGLDGVQKITIDSSLHHDEYTTQQAAYNAYVELMTQLNAKGWKQYFAPFVAAIDKRDNLKYMDENLGKVIDSSTILTFEEWRDRSGTITLNVYNNEILLNIGIDRRVQDREADREQYMMDYSFITQRYFGRNTIVSGSYKMNVEELEEAFKQSQLDDRKARHNDEVWMQERGYRIDESYVDPDIWQYVK